MIDVYFWPTGNRKKVTIMPEECGLPYNVMPVNINWQGRDLNDTPNVKRWFETDGTRPAVHPGSRSGEDLANFSPTLSDEDRKRLFNLRDQDLKARVS